MATSTPASGGGSVACWKDRSGSGNHARQSTAGKRPVFGQSARNGRPVLTFDGTDDDLAVAYDINPGTTPNLTVVAVFSSDVTGGTRAVYTNDDGAWDRGIALATGAATNFTYMTGSNYTGFFALSASTYYVTTTAYTSSSFSGWVDGGSLPSGAYFVRLTGEGIHASQKLLLLT